MGLGSLFKAAVDIVTLPVSVAADVVTLGAKKAMDGESFTEEKIEKIAEELDEVTD